LFSDLIEFVEAAARQSGRRPRFYNAGLVERTIGVASGTFHAGPDLVEVESARRLGREHRLAYVVDQLGEEQLLFDRCHRFLDRDLAKPDQAWLQRSARGSRGPIVGSALPSHLAGKRVVLRGRDSNPQPSP
jgi:hypothetical protein